MERQLAVCEQVSAEKENQVIAEFEKNIYDLEQMIEISRSFCTTIELNSLIESILYVAMAQMRVTGAGVFVMENIDSEYFQLSDNYSGIEVDKSIDYKIPVKSPLIDFFTSSSKPYTLDELKKGLPGCMDTSVFDSLEPSLIVPLLLKNRINGILVMGERIFIDGMDTGYSDYEKNEISTIASLASVAVHNASLIEQASTDMMTKLKLKFFFFNILEDKLDFAMSHEQPLSVVMFDIDFFKKFNDTYGHACGDYVLKTVAKLIKDNIRASDLASRYGGEEFTVMLCDTDKETAFSIADRIRKNIEEYNFEYEGTRMSVTISGGISVFSTDENSTRSAKVLVDQADRALYVSKRNGRNQISVLSDYGSDESK